MSKSAAGRSKKKAAPTWVWLPGAWREIDCHALFRREFDLAALPAAGELRIAAADQYRLYVNGRLIGDGPARAERPKAIVDSYPLAALYLKKGRNCVAVLSHLTMLPQHGQALVPGGLWVELELKARSGRTTHVGTDASWRVTRDPQFVKPSPRRFFAVGFNETIDFTAALADWAWPGFDDRGWDRAEVVSDRYFHRLLPRSIPMLRFEEWKPVLVRRSGRVGSLDGVWGLAFAQCAKLPHAKERVFGTWVYSDSEREATLAFGCDNWARVTFSGDVAWEQGRPDAGYRNHLEYDREKYTGMIRGNGARFEPGSSRKSAVPARNRVQLKKGWNRLTIWIWQPDVAYGFEGTFTDSATLLPVAGTVCSARRDLASPNTWAILRDESAKIESAPLVQSLLDDQRPYLDPSHLFDWDVQTLGRRPPQGTKSLLAKSAGKGPMKLLPGEFIEFQLPRDGVGFLDLELRGPRGAAVDVTISEAQTKGGRMRALYNGLWQTDRLLLSGQWDHWLSLDRRAGRYLAITVRRSSGPVEVRRFALKTQHYPVAHPGTFECDDWVLTQMWKKGANTVDAATFDLSEDCPTHKKGQWGGDTYLRLFETTYLWGDLRQNASALREFAEDQKADRWGRPMVPCGFGDKLVEYCCLLGPWVWHYYRFTGDLATVRETFHGVENLLKRAGSLVDRRGFAQAGPDPRDGIYIDYTMTPTERCGDTIGMMQCAYLLALDSGALVAELLGRREQAAGYRRQAETLRERVGQAFWVEKEGLFADGLREGKPGDTFSAVTNYWMMLAGIPSPEQEERLMRRLWLKPGQENMDFWSRGESPYTKFFMSEALLSRGLWRQGFAAWRGYYGTMLRHYEAICVFEMWERGWKLNEPVPRNSLVHPFAIGPMSHLASHVAGIQPLRPGFDGIFWEPMPGDLKWLKAEFPLVGRDETVCVEMKTLKSGGRRLVLTRPRGLEVVLSPARLGPKDQMAVEDK